MKLRVVLFDLDGTVADSAAGVTRSVQYALASKGISEPELSKLRCFIGPPLADSFQRYYGFAPAECKELIAKYRERYQPIGIFECSLYPGMKDCLRALREQGLYLAITSSKPEPMCERVLEHLGIRELFHEVCGASLDERLVHKHQVLELFFSRHPEYSREECILVGDTIFDAEGAARAGIASLGVSYGFGDTAAMLAAGAEALCDTTAELCDVLLKRS